jgi:heat-inducible transcriptional repressor
MDISPRKKTILQAIIKEYVKTAQPVSSSVIADKCQLGVSSATVRNEMIELEDDGYIHQPHTSAGRVPTEAAYELFVGDLFDRQEPKGLKEAELVLLEKLFSRSEAAYKQTAKAIAELSGNAVFWAFHKNNLYYTGLSNLFSQPEFKQNEIVYDVSVVIDRLEEIIDELFDDLALGQKVLIGSQNPFGNFLSTVLIKYKTGDVSAVFGILGPLRMDYGHNLALANFIKNKFI